MINAPSLTEEECLVCDRVGVATYYRELREVGFTRQFALKILKVLAQIYFKDHTFFAGRARGPIKAAVAYAVYSYAYGLLSSAEVLRIRENRGVGTSKAVMILGFKHGILDEENCGMSISTFNASVDDPVWGHRISSFNQTLLAWKLSVSEAGMRTLYHSIMKQHLDIVTAVCGAKLSVEEKHLP